MTHHYMEHEKETPETRADELMAAMYRRMTDWEFLGYRTTDLHFEVLLDQLNDLKSVCREGVNNGLVLRDGTLFYKDIRIVGRLLLRNSPVCVRNRGVFEPATDPTRAAPAGGYLHPGPGTGQPPMDLMQNRGTPAPATPMIPPRTPSGADVLREISNPQGAFFLGTPAGPQPVAVFEGEELVIPFVRVHHLTKAVDVIINERDEREEELVLHVHFDVEREDSDEIPTVVEGDEARKFLEQWKAYLQACRR